MRRVSSLDNANKTNKIIFQIGAEEFSAYERNYNNALANITEFLENPSKSNVLGSNISGGKLNVAM